MTPYTARRNTPASRAADTHAKSRSSRAERVAEAIKPVNASHIVIVHGIYAAAILDGRKTIEARLMQTRRAPLGCVRVGDRLFFKSGGGFVATSVVTRVDEFDGLTPEGVETLRSRFDERVMGGAKFWKSRRRAKFAVMVAFDRVERASRGPVHAGLFGAGWKTING